MSRMGIQAATTMRELQQKLDLIGHNVANANTTGYKTQMANFSSLLYQNIDNFSDEEANSVGRVTPLGIRQGAGAKVGHTNNDFTQGALITTERPLDLALTEDGQFFEVAVTENGETGFEAGDIIGQVADVNVAVGRLEGSNVELSTQMTELIQTQRAYQFNARTISMHDQMRGLINQMR